METCLIHKENHQLAFVEGVRFDTMFSDQAASMFIYWVVPDHGELAYWSVTHDATGMRFCKLPRQAIPGDDFLIAMAIIEIQKTIKRVGIARVLSRLREAQTVKEDNVESN